VAIGAGDDDAAWLLGTEEGCVVTTDALVDGVHFVLDRCGPEAAAHKALGVNVSDLAAMAAEPLGFVVSVVLPERRAADLAPALLRGLVAAAEAYGCPLVGGDTNVGPGPLVLAVTAIGRPGPGGLLRRAGATPGERISVTGPLGGSVDRAFGGRHLKPPSRVRAALALRREGVARSGMDLSDGLARDLPRLCRASGVGARIEAELVPVHPDAHALGGDPLLHAIGDGEDFELLVTHAPLSQETRRRLEQEGVALIEIGEVRPAVEGVSWRRAGVICALPAVGYDHFLRGSPPC
jgi:thiamine-monophosphate kinase